MRRKQGRVESIIIPEAERRNENLLPEEREYSHRKEEEMGET